MVDRHGPGQPINIAISIVSVAEPALRVSKGALASLGDCFPVIRDPEHWALALPETHACNESPESLNGAGQRSSLQHQRPTIQSAKHPGAAGQGSSS